jgi:hypothetical protein
VLVVNGLITAALIGSFGLLTPTTPRALMIVLLFAHGLSRSMQFTSISTLAFVDIPQPQMSSANSFFTVMTQMSMGMGVAVGAVTLRLAAWLHGGPSSTPTIADFHVAFGMVSIVAVLAAVLARRGGDERRRIKRGRTKCDILNYGTERDGLKGTGKSKVKSTISKSKVDVTFFQCLVVGVLVPAHDRIAIHLTRVGEGDLARMCSGLDVRFRGELVRRHARIETDVVTSIGIDPGHEVTIRIVGIPIRVDC